MKRKNILKNILLLCCITNALLSCSKNKSVSSDGNTAARHAQDSSSNTHKSTRVCKWKEAEKQVQEVPCTMRSVKQDFEFQLKLANEKLVGTAHVKNFGFLLKGTLSGPGKKEKLEIDLWKQEDGSFATVFPLQDNRLIRLHVSAQQ